MSWYKTVRGLLGAWLPTVADVRVSGREHVPASGPFFLVPNHQSVLDPIVIQCHCGRVVHTFTKSSQFRSPLFRFVLPRVNAIPVRRFRVDPQAVRVALRRLRAGEGVCVYPEGERSWDGTLQPFRRGTLRLLLGAGVPVVPAWVAGSYHVWPRWGRRPQRGVVHVRFGPPLEFGRHEGRRERDAALPEAEARLVEAMLALAEGGEPGGSPRLPNPEAERKERDP